LHCCAELPGCVPVPAGALLAVPVPAGALLAVPVPAGALLAVPVPAGALLAVPVPVGALLAVPVPAGALLAVWEVVSPGSTLVHIPRSASNWASHSPAVNGAGRGLVNGLRPLVAGFPLSPGQDMWDLWWTKLHWGRFSPSTSVSPTDNSTDCCTLIMNHPGLVQSHPTPNNSDPI
jgi:hypothetical protein